MTTRGFVFHPGEHIAEELETRGWTQKYFAQLIKKSPQEVNHIISGRRNLDADWAYRLSAAFGTSAQVWLNLQAKYDLAVLEEDKEEIKLFDLIRLNVEKQEIFS